MPRQPMAYVVPKPLEALNLEEVKFWLAIMQEHAVIIKSGLPCDCTDLIEETQNFYREFGALLTRAEKAMSEKKFLELVRDAYESVKEFHCFKHHLLRLKMTCKLGGYIYPLLLDHMAREAEYTMRLFDKMKDCRPVLKTAAQTQETAFWVRIMGDHAEFISHLLDPSERSLVAAANEFACEFDELLLQNLDFISMLHHNDTDVISFKRFLQDIRVSTRELRDFKRAVQDMVAQCKLLGLIPEMLADHVRREAEHFLMILSMIDKGVMKNSVSCGAMDEPEVLDDYYLDGVHENHCVLADDCGNDDECDYHHCGEREEDHHKEAKFDMPVSLSSEPVPVKEVEADFAEEEADDEPLFSPKPTIAVKPAKQDSPKHKWGSKWPRPLGKK